MAIIIAAFICFALGIGVYFLLLMADGRRLRERLLDRRPSFVPGEPEKATPPITSGYASWMAPTPEPPGVE